MQPPRLFDRPQFALRAARAAWTAATTVELAAGTSTLWPEAAAPLTGVGLVLAGGWFAIGLGPI